MLQVSDDGLRPITEVESAVRAIGHADGAEVLVVLGIGVHEVLQGFAFGTRAFVGDTDTKDALETDDVGIEEVALEFLGEMRT